MAQIQITIDSVYDGFMPTGQVGQRGQYLSALGIDPDMPISDASGDTRASAAIRPVSYQPFSGPLVSSYPIAIIPNPKNPLTYVVLRDGKILSYDSALESGSETLVTSLSTTAHGAWYYSNFLYITSPTNVARYGPLDGSATVALIENAWTSTTIASLTALENTAYPNSILGIPYLNHFGITHVDNCSYFLDYKNGVGMVHKLATTKQSIEGDIDNGSAYALLNLPKNYMPTTITTFGNDMVVSGTFVKNENILQGKAALFFFNPADTTPSFYKILVLPDAICTVLKYVDGVLYGLSGDLAGGYRLWEYVGGDTIQTIKIIENGHLPLQGAADAIGNKIAWGADTTDPMISSGLLSYGSKSDLLPRGLHHIGITSYT